MASSFLYEEQFLCSICLDAFTEPVTTPCGHNYCKSCITGYWASTDLIQCPLCKKKFHKRPQLQVNTEFRDMVEHFNNMRVRGGDDILAKPGEVPCDICLEPKLKAQKTCLVCLASYCQTHLEPHQRVTNLKKHQLIDPVSNLEDRVCKKHDKTLEFFCNFDQKCICSMCLKEEHATHEAVALEQASRERKAGVDYVMSEIKVMENSKSRSIKEIKYTVEQSKRRSEKEIADISEVFTALVVSLQRGQAELIEVIQEKQRAAQEEAEDQLTQLEQEVAELRRRRSEMEQLLQSEDHLCFLQSWPSLSHIEGLFERLSRSSPAFTPDLTAISQQSYVGTVKKTVAQMEKTLSNEMEMLIHEVRLSDGCEAAEQRDAAEELMTDEFVEEVWTPPQDKLMMIQQCYAVDVTLDTNMLHSKFMVSKDGKQLRYGEGLLFFFSNLLGARSENQPFVLGKEGFSSGKFYYQVRVSGSKSWVLGVVKEPVNRKKRSIPTLEDGGWTLCGLYNDFQEECFANSDRSSLLNLKQRPQTVGVFVDYDKGEISFFDVDARTLIYSYTQCAFIQNVPTMTAFLYFMTGTTFNNRPKLHPVFGFFEEDPNNMLEITPVACET
ncbi:E3 ubiquitin/ISG15 ligase TRIM25-like [Plectropomus leopardus]|uniref:E3 ubiquitin/ISG15 ligase TRIM25-like n=1 Tax=Plectropomus leopardus TaxID=160734 RepID=UPI001C4DA64D|nr:E3 ubiquitin/ISG15 ligase TRIM25-like [Plectropomus leopardus]XP_042366937.1 E3 ubiquitin/ISG15 ligase TRIM25-like [Plectropomus leopardus]